jgi:uncharacterized protein
MYEEQSVKTKLQNLYALQQVDSHLDELQELKGDLPGEVQSLEEQLASLVDQHTNHEQRMRQSFTQRDDADAQIITMKERLEKYKKQQFAVRTNREYDALTREMDAATETITRLEKEMEQLEAAASVARTQMEETAAKITDLQKQLAEKRTALAEVSKTTEDEELRFVHEREKLVARIAKPDLVAYERIRKAKRGTAVVPVKRQACGGCHNRVPPQKLLELRKNDRIYTCERCGRIIVSDEIAQQDVTVE